MEEADVITVKTERGLSGKLGGRDGGGTGTGDVHRPGPQKRDVERLGMVQADAGPQVIKLEGLY